MPKPSNAYDGPFDRAAIAETLYLTFGGEAAAHRCEINQANGQIDFVAELVSSLGLVPGARMCDACCGAGDHLLRFADAVAPGGSAIGIDFSPDAVERARSKGCDARLADAADADACGDGLDAVNCAFGIYYLPEPRRAVEVWARALRPGGRLVISGPALDTNQELYAFHRAVTGLDPSDADRMALGYVDREARRLVVEAGLVEITTRRIENPIQFTPEEFVLYWTMTSLFARSALPLQRWDDDRYQRQAPEMVTKVTDVLVAVRSGT
jgi:SAM-dependent methyltransferase